MDVHSGGFDLKFPHHDNELAQAEVGADDHSVLWGECLVHGRHTGIVDWKVLAALWHDGQREASLERFMMECCFPFNCVSVCLYTCLYVCTSKQMCAHTHIQIHIQTHIHTHPYPCTHPHTNRYTLYLCFYV